MRKRSGVIIKSQPETETVQSSRSPLRAVRSSIRARTRLAPRFLVLCSCIFAIILLGATLTYTWLRPSTPAGVQPQQATAQPTFKPVVGDVNDPEGDDPDVTVQQS